jgi:hypothetical protein
MLPILLAALILTGEQNGLDYSKSQGRRDSIPEKPSGLVCVAKIPKATNELYLGTKPPAKTKSTFLVTLDGRDSARTTSDSGAQFSKVDTSKAHKIRIYFDGKVRDSFEFDFQTRGSKSLCLYYRKPYGTWILEPLSWHANKCSCQE